MSTRREANAGRDVRGNDRRTTRDVRRHRTTCTKIIDYAPARAHVLALKRARGYLNAIRRALDVINDSSGHAARNVGRKLNRLETVAEILTEALPTRRTRS